MYYVRNGNAYVTAAHVNQDYHTSLPVGTYVIGFNPMIGFYFQISEPFEIKGKVYGSATTTVKRVLDTYQKRGGNTGVMLSGEKGSGKTMTTKLISMVGAKTGIPTLIINSALCGDGFNSFMQSIKQECIVIFDEFEKVYDASEQEQLLTLFDGVFQSKKLFLITCNDKYKVAQHMMNRPGRIYYHLEYSGLEYDFIREYCEDRLNNQAQVESVCRVGAMFAKFNFDMLKALVEEMNRYDENPMEVLKYLNAKPDSESLGTHKVELFADGTQITGISPDEFRDNPLKSDTITINEYYEEEYSYKDDEGKRRKDTRSQYRAHKFTLADLVNIDASTGEFIYERENERLVLTRQKPKIFNLSSGQYNSYFED